MCCDALVNPRRWRRGRQRETSEPAGTVRRLPRIFLSRRERRLLLLLATRLIESSHIIAGNRAARCGFLGKPYAPRKIPGHAHRIDFSAALQETDQPPSWIAAVRWKPALRKPIASVAYSFPVPDGLQNIGLTQCQCCALRSMSKGLSDHCDQHGGRRKIDMTAKRELSNHVIIEVSFVSSEFLFNP